MSMSVWIKRDSGGTGELTISVRGNASDIMSVRLSEIVTVKSGNIEASTAFILSSTRWTHYVVELDFTSYVLTVFIDNLQKIRKVGLTPLSITSGSVHMSSTKDAGVTLSGLTFYPRKLSAEEVAMYSTSCLSNSSDTLYSMVDVVQNIVDGLVIISPSSCDPFDECATAPCGNHTCVNGMGTFMCVCSGGWSGTLCEMPPDFCLNHDCKHGICVQGSGKYTCNCTDFYTGGDCSIPPVNGGWSSWSDRSGCGVTCGGSTQTRQRFCVEPEPGPGGLDCTGSKEETQQCNVMDCPDYRKQ
ncbi:slit homolog 1 protein-like [Dreissena polymorpha]|uniref:slit homolog 1 protein-like n=1 Tax=Dreissena polymorpha TaxID=45954 RepID=UPI0022655091|nr:slit homolog 1 protein-like [Dreissena polymorpha]